VACARATHVPSAHATCPAPQGVDWKVVDVHNFKSDLHSPLKHFTKPGAQPSACCNRSDRAIQTSLVEPGGNVAAGVVGATVVAPEVGAEVVAAEVGPAVVLAANVGLPVGLPVGAVVAGPGVGCTGVCPGCIGVLAGNKLILPV
jgi:hypothetical protein